MADWTTIPDTTFEPGAPAKGRDMRFLRDNPIAIAEGASGAPRIQTDGIGTGAVTNPKLSSSAVTNAKVSNGTLGAEKFQTGATERNWVLARAASANTGAVGSYAFLALVSGSSSGGDTTAGSNLSYAAATSEGGVSTGGTPSGTWRNMGRTLSTGNATVFLRVS